MEKRHVYILRSVTNPTRHYVGLTSDLPVAWKHAMQADQFVPPAAGRG